MFAVATSPGSFAQSSKGSDTDVSVASAVMPTLNKRSRSWPVTDTFNLIACSTGKL